MTIRLYTPSDLDACRALWVELTEHHRRIYKSDSIGGDDPGRQFDEHLARVGPDNIWVAVNDDRIVGLAGLIPDGDADAGEIEPVVVTETHRGTGVGRTLVTTILTTARERGLRRLSVRPVARNESALRFFRAMGLTVVGHVELFMDTDPDKPSTWKPGPTLGECEFRC